MTTVPAEHETEPLASYHDREPLINPWLIRLPILFLSAGVLLVLILTIGVGLFQINFANKIIPGVSAYGIDLSGMSVEARAAGARKQLHLR